MQLTRTPISQLGPHVSPLIAGLWRLKNWGMGPQDILRYLEQCIELGVTTMDHAMVYRSEAPFGAALALKPSLRQQMQIITKFGIRAPGYGELGAQKTKHYDSGSDAIIASTENSLKALGTDFIDILLIHRPDYLMDVYEVAEAFAQLKAQGKARYFGVSNFSIHQFEALQNVWPDGLITNQVEFSPYHMQTLDSGVFEQCAAHGARPMVWSALAGGQILAPTDAKGERLLSALKIVAEEVGAANVEQVVYAWIQALPCQPLPLLGTSKIERVRNAVEGMSISLNREQWYAIWEASNGAAVP
jgi:predicted oxidoreductase